MTRAISKDQISIIIKDLVLFNECVVIPGYGAIISNPMMITRHPVTHLIQKPEKNVLFNPSINIDDGLLVGHLMKCFELSYSEAKKCVADFVALIQKDLQQGNPFEIKGVGEFRLGINSQIIFRKSQEFLTIESYGLKSVYAVPILREQVSKRELQEKEVIEIPVTGSKTERKRTAGIFYWLGPAVAASVFLFLYLVTPNINLYDEPLVQFGLGADVKLKKPLPIEAPARINIYKTRKAAQPENLSTFTIESARFYLISESFASLDNAKAHINELTEMGFNAFIVDRSPSGLYRVGYSVFDNFAKANRELEAIRKSINPNAWLLVK